MERVANKYDLLNQAYADEHLKRTTKAVMQYLVALSNSTGCHPAVATIARAVRTSERTVQRHIRILEQAGYIIKKTRFYHQEQLTNEYLFPLDVIEEAEHTGVKSGSRAETTLQKRAYMDQIYQASLSAGEQVVLIYFIHKANRQGRVIKLKADIMQACHMSWRLVCRYLVSLQHKGILIGYSRRNYVCCRLQPQEQWQMPMQTADETPNATPEKQPDNPDAAGMHRTGQVYPESEKVYQEKHYPDDHSVKILIPEGKRKNVKQFIRQALKNIRKQLHRWLGHLLS